jgi:malate dehydrogenase (oxaloacetate-decarboxylating)(NADP+)
MSDKGTQFSDKEALLFHAQGRPGKIEITPTKPMATQRDLSLAYSPGVAIPVKAIAEDSSTAYDYTAKGNLVAVISNGTAILGMGALGALASKPVMEGKAVLFKRFADIDGIDLEVDTEDVEEFIGAVRYLGPSFGGINLEDIKSPECFIIEKRLREMMDIPVFHDDQHGTAIILAAALINALSLTGRKIEKIKVVVAGAGAAAIACTNLIKSMGLPHENLTMCDIHGVVYKGREVEMDPWKEVHARDTKMRTLAEAVKGADAIFGLSAKGVISKDMVKSMAKNPIIFAMANPDPEITPEEVAEVRDDAIMATGRSDYPNQVNNVLGFPYIFRGALDVRASSINEDMKIAAAEAIAELAREEVPDEVATAYAGKAQHYGPEYIIPSPFDPRLIEAIPPKVAEAAMKSGVATKPIEDFDAYRTHLRGRMNPTVSTLSQMFRGLKKNPRRVLFAEAEEMRVIRAALSYRDGGYGSVVLIGQEKIVKKRLDEAGVEDLSDIEVYSAKSSDHRKEFSDFLYDRLARRGYVMRDIRRLVNRDRNVFGACMVALGYADAMVTGVTRGYSEAFKNIRLAIDPKPGHRAFGMAMMVLRERTIFIADATASARPDAEEMADIAEQAAEAAERLGHTPRVGFLSFSNFGKPAITSTKNVHQAVTILDTRGVDFEYEGEMSADVALNYDLQRELYPVSRLTGPANVLIMPGLHSANISYKMLAELGGGSVIGPMTLGLSHSVQITRMGSRTSDIINMAGLAAMGSIILAEEAAD